MKLGNLEVDLTELKGFIADAKKSCYAGNGQEDILPDGSKQLTFQRGNFHYTDNYSGYFQAPGTEIVRWQREDGQRIWQMSYSGGMLPEFIGDDELAKKTFAFLKEALSVVPSEKPFRGPVSSDLPERNWVRKRWVYLNEVQGDLSRFRGEENIFFGFGNECKEIFSQEYMGGLVIPR